MVSPHVLSDFILVVPYVVEELFVVHQPVSVEEEHKWSVLHDREDRVAEGVVHSWWLSVVVSVLMNLGSIPDYVASRFIICNDFNIGFMGLMDEYKKDFFEKHGRPWAYSNPKLIDEYIGFKRARESFQRDYADQKEGGQIEMQEK